MKRFINKVLIILCLFLIAGWFVPALEAKEKKRVLVLFSEDETHPAHEMTLQGIRAVFDSNNLFDIQLFIEYSNESWFGTPAQDKNMADYLRRKYSGIKISSIITVYPYAMNFLLAERETFYPQTPIIAAEIVKSCIEELKPSAVRRFITGTIVGDNIAGLIADALRLKPKTKRIALIGGTNIHDVYEVQLFLKAIKTTSDRTELIDLTNLSMEETLTRVGSLPPDTLVFYTSILTDGAGKSFVPRKALNLIARAANAPVFGLYESYLGFGIVGGNLVSFEEHGKEAAKQALLVMEGKAPSSIPLGGDQAYKRAYDWREIKRWNIAEASLPRGSDLRFRTPTLWEEHHQLIISAAALAIVETVLILGLLVNIRRRRKVELELRESTHALQVFSTKLIENQEENLRWLSRELHDDLTQRLAALAIEAGILQKTLQHQQPLNLQQVADLKAGLAEVSDDVHNLSRQLHPSLINDMGLAHAIQAECDAFSRRTEIKISFESGEIASTTSPDIALCLFRVIQEALQNIARHAEAKEAQVILKDFPDSVYLLIQDSGIGFDTKQAAGKGGIGLLCMKERIKMVNGTLSIISKPGNGTKIEIIIPHGKKV